MRINVNDTDRLKSKLADVNGRASSFVLESWDVRQSAEHAEARLDKVNLPKKYRKGIRACIASNGAAASSYKYGAAGTCVWMERGSKDWFVTSIERITVYPNELNGLRLSVDKGTEQNIVNSVFADLKIDVRGELP